MARSERSRASFRTSCEGRALAGNHPGNPQPRQAKSGHLDWRGRILTLPPERRIYPAAPVPLARLPDKSGVPVGVATRLGGGAGMRPVGFRISDLHGLCVARSVTIARTTTISNEQ